jgi:hypothetical protein
LKKKGFTLYFCLLLIASVLLTGCTRKRVWTYSPDPYARGVPLVDKTVVVLPLTDAREPANKEMLSMWLVPLVPFGWANLNTPEGASAHVTSLVWTFDPGKDMARAIAEELNNSRIFRKVSFSQKSTDGDFVLSGVIKSTLYRGEKYSYGLSIFSFSAWLLGFPYGTADNELYIELTLQDPNTEQVLWKHESRRGKASTSWIYTFKPDFFYEDLLKGTMKLEVLPSLKETFAGVSVK